MSNHQFIRLFYNILPGVVTFLHKLVTSHESKHLTVMKSGFKLADMLGLEIPLLHDGKGRTPFNIALDCVDPST